MTKVSVFSFGLVIALTSISIALILHGNWSLGVAALGLVAGFHLHTRIVVRMVSALEAIRVVPERVREALDTLAEGLVILDENERIVIANRAFSSILGHRPDQLSGRLASSLPWVAADALTAERPAWLRAIHDSVAQIDQVMRYRMPNGQLQIFSVNATPIQSADGYLRGALVTFRDVTHVEQHRTELENMLAMLRNSRDEVRKKNRELEVLASRDALTGCLNRRAFFERFEQQWSGAVKNQSHLSCLMIDIDHFKQINDKYGHQVGDEALRRVAEELEMLTVNRGVICRYGGEEFCITLPGGTLHESTELAECIRQVVEQIRLDIEGEVRLSVSVGLSDGSMGATSVQELINQADQSLYVAKRTGRNRVTIYSAEVADTALVEQQPEGSTTPAAAPAKPVPFQAVMALVSALAYRDPETAEHSRRVADYCVRAAEGMLDQRRTYVLEIAALLHDIGKIGVPDEVLLKPGPLTADEWKLMRRHDRIGVEIVAGTFGDEELTEIMRTRLAHFGAREADNDLPSGEHIPLTARLLSIADSYDAMTSQRVFRPRRTHEQAVAELQRCAGTQFDPDLVERFVHVISGQPLKLKRSSGLPKQTAMQLGLQIERLADAMDQRDLEGLQTLASRLREMARSHHIDAIAEAAEKLEFDATQETFQWLTLLRDTQELLDLCRAAQDVFFVDAVQAPEVQFEATAGDD